MQIKLFHRLVAEFDTSATEATMRSNCPYFFKVKHGKRETETYTVYKGALIVRNTVQFSAGNKRMTAVYLYFSDFDGSPELACASAGSNVNSIAQAKKLVDRIIAAGEYHHGI